VTRLRTGQTGFDSQQEVEFLFLVTTFRPSLGPTQPSVQWVVGVRWQGREADHSHPSRTEVKNACSHTSIPPYVFMERYLFKYRDSFAFTFNCFKANF
jgi:hypothetical protein